MPCVQFIFLFFIFLAFVRIFFYSIWRVVCKAMKISIVTAALWLMKSEKKNLSFTFTRSLGVATWNVLTIMRIPKMHSLVAKVVLQSWSKTVLSYISIGKAHFSSVINSTRDWHRRYCVTLACVTSHTMDWEETVWTQCCTNS